MDGRPHFDGEALCKTLLARGVRCTYMHLNAIAFVMDSVTKVLLGASAVKSNGAVLARSGTAVVAMAAHNARKPVLICAQSIKFHEAVQLDSITSNEQGNPQARCFSLLRICSLTVCLLLHRVAAIQNPSLNNERIRICLHSILATFWVVARAVRSLACSAKAAVSRLLANV